jgi:hypothetical protein
MTHAVHPQHVRFDAEGNETPETNSVNLKFAKRRPTDDIKTDQNFPGAQGGYYWGNVNSFKDTAGWKNAGTS